MACTSRVHRPDEIDVNSVDQDSEVVDVAHIEPSTSDSAAEQFCLGDAPNDIHTHRLALPRNGKSKLELPSKLLDEPTAASPSTSVSFGLVWPSVLLGFPVTLERPYLDYKNRKWIYVDIPHYAVLVLLLTKVTLSQAITPHIQEYWQKIFILIVFLVTNIYGTLAILQWPTTYLTQREALVCIFASLRVAFVVASYLETFSIPDAHAGLSPAMVLLKLCHRGLLQTRLTCFLRSRLFDVTADLLLLPQLNRYNREEVAVTIVVSAFLVLVTAAVDYRDRAAFLRRLPPAQAQSTRRTLAEVGDGLLDCATYAAHYAAATVMLLLLREEQLQGGWCSLAVAAQ